MKGLVGAWLGLGWGVPEDFLSVEDFLSRILHQICVTSRTVAPIHSVSSLFPSAVHGSGSLKKGCS